MPAPEDLRPGIYVMSVTPFDRNGALDEGALRAHLRRMAAARVEGVYLASHQTGEGPLLTPAETWRVFDIGVEELKGKVPVLAANLESPDAARNIELMNEAMARGMDAVQLYPPTIGHSIVPARRELEQFYRDVFSKCSAPVVLSSNDALGFVVPLDVHAALLDEYPHIIGFNKYNRDENDLAAFVEVIGARKPVFTNTSHLLFSMMLGGHGSLHWVQNITPRLFRAFFDAFMKGERAAALEHFMTITRLQRAMVRFGIGTKAALRILGLPGGYRRRPYVDAETGVAKQFAQAVGALGIGELGGLH